MRTAKQRDNRKASDRLNREHLNAQVASWRKKNPELSKQYDDAYKKQRRMLLDALKVAPCMDCRGVFPSCVMDFDHVRGKKLFAIGTRLYGSWKALLREAEKCDLVCANCHRIRTKSRRMELHDG